VRLSDGLFSPTAISQLPDGYRPSQLGADADGFPATTPITFEASEPLDSQAPADHLVKVVDLTTGQRVDDVIVVASAEAALRGAPARIISVWPRTRWPFGHRIGAVLRRSAPTATGRSIEIPPVVARAVEGDGTVLTPDERRLIDELTTAERADVANLTTFTVRSGANAAASLDRLAEEVRAAPHPLRNTRVEPTPLLPHVAGIVHGELQLTDFRDSSGTIPRDNPVGRPAWTPFDLYLPTTPPPGRSSAPLVVYGAGLKLVRQTALPFAIQNAARGIATLSIEQPYHGERVPIDRAAFPNLLQPQQLGRVDSMILQSPLDMLSALLAVTDPTRPLDMLTNRPVCSRPCDRWLPDGLADLDITRIGFEATSLGSVLGGSFLAIAPEVDAADLHVGGVGMMALLSTSSEWNDAEAPIRSLVPDRVSPGEGAALVGLAQMAIDRGEAANVVDRYHGALLLEIGAGDRVVPLDASVRLAALSDLVAVPGNTTLTTPLPPAGAPPSNRRWAATFFTIPVADDFSGFIAHGAFLLPDAFAERETLLDQLALR